MPRPDLKQNSQTAQALLAVIATFVGLVPTVYATYVSNSITLFSDFLRCLAEFIAVLLAWIILKKISRSDRVAYNYGFGKFENIASLAVAASMCVSFLVLAFLVYHRFTQPVELYNTGFGMCLSSLAVLANTALAVHYYRYNKSNPSAVIDAQWKLFRAKSVASLVVVGSLAATYIYQEAAWVLYCDVVGSALVALFLLYSAYSILTASMTELVDRSIAEVYQLEILRVLIHHEQLYTGFQGIRSRRSGVHMHIELLLEFDLKQTMEIVYSSIRAIQTELEAALPGSDIRIIASPPG